MKKLLSLLFYAALILSMFAGCTTDQPITAPDTTAEPTEPATTLAPIEESYKYKTKSGYYLWPCLAENWVERKVLTTTTEDGTFSCMTTDKAQANDFIVAQRTMLRFLRGNGVVTGELEYYATDYDDSFSESSDGAAYIALSEVRTWKQIMVTLQSLWGDYTDYGYVWALSNAIAREMGWETESAASIDQAALDDFFAANPEAVNLLYPSFTTQYASQETVDSCKALTAALFEKVDWRAAVAKPVDKQLDDWRSLVSAYANDISIPFTRQTIGYAYYSKHVPLRIMTTYVEMMVASNYSDYYTPAFYAPYFSDYETIYQTVNTMNSEITAAVAFFGLEENAGVITMKWVNYADNAVQKYLVENSGMYYYAAETAYVSTIHSYLHEYYHHLRYTITGDYKNSWQTEAFSEMGEANSFWPQYRMDVIFKLKEYAEMFYAFTGRAYQPGRDDYYEVVDILCYLENNYTLKYHDGGPTISISRYLIDCYGEKTAYQLVAFPNTVVDVTGKTWDELASEWEQHIRNKYAHVNISDWVNG